MPFITFPRALFLLSFAAIASPGFAESPFSAPLGKTQQLTAPDQVPEGLEKSEWLSIRAAHQAWQHEFRQKDGVWQARNKGQQWTAKFDGRRFLTKPDQSSWSWGLELRSYGFGTCQKKVSGVPKIKDGGQRLSYQWQDGIEEWFVNDEHGLEHGFTVPNQPEGGQTGEPLVFTLGTLGGLRSVVAADAQSVNFRDENGATVVNYAGLKVWDAEGKILSSRFEQGEQGQFYIAVEQANARYPLTIDPIAQQAYLKASNTGSNDQFGRSVAVSGNTVVVGALREDSDTTGVDSIPNNNAQDSGAAYVFVNNGGVWSQQAYLKAHNTDTIDGFGSFVGISGNTIVVGAPFEDSSTTGINSIPNKEGQQSGAVYVFLRSGGVWSQQAYIKPSNTGDLDRFGNSVAVNGDTLVVGAPREDSLTNGVNSTPNDNGNECGAAYVFFRAGGIWSEQAYLKASNTGSANYFGTSVGISGNTIVVGAPFEESSTIGVNSTPDELAQSAGAAYVFVRDGTTWSEQAYLKASNTGIMDWFGHSVSVSADMVVIGAPYEDSSTTGVNSAPNESSENAGAAYIFERSGGVWRQQAYLKASNAASGAEFGFAVGASVGTVVIGSGGESSSSIGVNSTPFGFNPGSGASYVFVANNGSWSQQAHLKASNSGTFERFGEAVAVSGTTVIVGAWGENSSTTGVNSTPNDALSNAGAAYIFTGLGPIAPEITVFDGAVSDTEISNREAATPLGNVLLGNTSRTQTFTVHNDGVEQLTGLAVTKPANGQPGDFSVNITNMATSLAPGASTTFSVSFGPKGLGVRTATIQIASNDPDENPFEIVLSGTGIPPPQPYFVIQPPSQLVLQGNTVAFNPEVTGDTPMTYQWRKGTTAINGATQGAYSIQVTKTSDAGAYSVVADNPVGLPVSSQSAYLALVTPVSGTQVLKKGATLNLKSTVAAPTATGVAVHYAWKLGAELLVNGTRPSGAVVSGADKASLSITKMGMTEAGDYTCVVTLDTPENDPELPHGLNTVRVVDAPPVMNPIPLLVTAYVAQVIDVTVTATNFPSGFQVSGLPVGLKLDAKTGRITGQPTTASKRDKLGNVIPNKISFKATNAWGTGQSLDFFMTILPLEAPTIGTFNGLVDRSIVLNPVADKTEGLGGTLRVVTASTGAVSGSLKLGTVTHTLKGTLITPTGGGDPTCQIVIPRKLPETDLTLAFTLNRSAGTLSGTVRDASTVPNSADVSAVLASKSAGLVGLYNSALRTQAPEGNTTYPQGTGFLTLNVTAAGVATWGGRLADNTTITGSSSYGPAGQVPMHLLIYTNTGSVQGMAQITGSDIGGTLKWFKASQPIKSTTRSYKGGFPLHQLTVDGGRYTKPAAGSRAMGLPEGLQMLLTDGGLANPIAQQISLTNGNIFQIPANAAQLKLALNATTGLITGSFIQTGLTVATPRKAEIFGGLIPSSTGAVGFFNFAENPDAVGETPTNTPLNSGAFELNAQ